MQQHLIIDADDTLWENNIYYEQAIQEFIGLLDHSSLEPHQVRAVLDEIELAASETRGYGSASFSRNLQECYLLLVERDVRTEELERVIDLGERILYYPIHIIDGVKETLEYLSSRHDLILLTKGHYEEQKLKIDSSGLGIYFRHSIIVKEKDVNTYDMLMKKFYFDPKKTWMIGNSPRSDINPALEVGLNAVYIPHPHTWSLEQQEIYNEGKGRLLKVSSFSELGKYF